MLSIFDIYKIGVGPSSSHTNGRMVAGASFVKLIQDNLDKVSRVQIDLYGSLSLTGRGHHTDKAVLWGLLGYMPDNIDIDFVNQELKRIEISQQLHLASKKYISFQLNKDLLFHQDSLPLHENGLKFSVFDGQGNLLISQEYYSVGGGFVVTAEEFSLKLTDDTPVPFPFNSAEEMLHLAEREGLSLATLILENEKSLLDLNLINNKVEKIWSVMEQGIAHSLKTEGRLPGGLGVIRRAPPLYKLLKSNQSLENDPMNVIDWVDLYAFAMAEENASGGKIVTSPTNGAAGVIPAVLKYYDQFVSKLDLETLRDFIAVSGAVGILYKMNASISGAEVGCQGEIGVSSSMAAAGLAAIMGASNEQVFIAAEIAMEHSLGMTCDPIGGLVQVPCIERNAMGAMKAINASRMALRRTSKSLISLDKVIDTMYQTGKDMNRKYRETSQGGLAIIYQAPPCE